MARMSSPTDSVAPPLSARAARLSSFVAERFPFALPALQRALQLASDQPEDDFSSDSMRPSLERAVRELLTEAGVEHEQIPDTTPRTSATTRLNHAVEELLDAVDGFLRREAISASLTPDERREILRGMILTRATDNRLKAFFSGGEVRYGRSSFQGKGFRSLGQEAIYAVAIRLKRGESFTSEGGWRGDVVAPLIRDLGVALAMSPTGEMVRGVLSAQMAKAGPPMNGKDLHVGDFSRGVLPASAPLTISTLTACGLAMAFTREQAAGADGRVAFSFIGEGGSSLGEWHEAINLAAARKLPMVFCIQNNQTALATPLNEQTAVRVFADKAIGYGVPGVTIDGTDPDAIAATFTWAAERARSGKGPALIELVAMRMCGHAHHDDMLYLGKEPPISWDYPKPTEQGYADREAYAWWSERDPIRTYAAKLETEGLIASDDLEGWKKEAEELVEVEARKVIDSPWPAAELAGTGVFADEPARRRIEVLENYNDTPSGLPELDSGPPFESGGRTFLDAVMLGVGDALRGDSRVFVYGEDVGGKYGNAFLLLRPLLEEFSDRILNSTLAEGGVLGVCIGAALGGQRPIGEIQFNDFVATGFNQLVNNAAKMRYRWGGGVPMVVRMPWGGLRHAGPYHSQNTEAWFYRTPGLKIVTPSTPYDARAMMAAAVADPDPVLFYEHIGLYRDPKIKQKLPDEAPEPLPIGKAALRRAGDDLAIISYGAYVHVAMRVAEKLANDGIEASVLDLRSVAPLDREAILQVARHCGRVMIIHEDTRTGSIGESIAAIIGEEAFDHLDAPVRIIGSLDTPVPYSPPLEKVFLPSEDEIEKAARLLVGY